ncbi:hypothetical protein PINS_up001464 [Pythium insidiosum]|nr:hypothetical protein PINS_up001464 [Pythium insidiosum]
MLRAATALLDDREEPALEAALTVFRNLTVSNEGALLLAAHAETLQKIAALLNAQPLKLIPERVVRLTLAVLGNVTRVFDGANVIADCAVTAPVLAVLKKCALYDAETVHAATLVILNAATHDQGKRLAIHLHAVEICLAVLAKVLQAKPTFQRCEATFHVELTRCLVSAVMALSTVEDAKPPVVEFGVEPLVACLHHESAAVRTSARIAINSACEAPRGVAAFVAKLLPEHALLVDVLGAKSIPALLPFLRDVDDDAQRHALSALVELVRHESGAHEVVQCLQFIETLVELLAQDARDVRSLAVAALQHVVQVSC